MSGTHPSESRTGEISWFNVSKSINHWHFSEHHHLLYIPLKQYDVSQVNKSSYNISPNKHGLSVYSGSRKPYMFKPFATFLKSKIKSRMPNFTIKTSFSKHKSIGILEWKKDYSIPSNKVEKSCFNVNSIEKVTYQLVPLIRIFLIRRQTHRNQPNDNLGTKAAVGNSGRKSNSVLSYITEWIT